MSGSTVDDIDSLLDHVENNYINKKKTAPKGPQSKDCPCNTKTPTDWEEVDDLLKDFEIEDTNPFGKQNNKSWARKESKPPGDAEKREVKCFPVYLSGSYDAMGHSETGFEKPCDRLKCLRCDFNVVALENYCWDESTDYLFLRMNMPEFDKLAVKLHKNNGSRAYACQCQHLNVTKMTNVSAVPQLRWVCGKHNILEKPVSMSTKYTQRF